MTGFVAVARREIVENRAVFLAALAAGFIPFATPAIRGLSGANAVEVRDLCAMFVATAFAVGLALLLGASVIARDLSARRLGFYFSRPLTSDAIWEGKLAGASVLVLGAASLALLPTFLVSHRLLTVWATLPLALLLLPIAHALSVLFRSRSVRLTLDLLLAGLASGIVALAARALLGEMAPQAAGWGLAVFGIVVWIAFLAAGIVALARGRVDIRAAHAALSTVLWSAVLSGALLFAGLAAWVLSAGPSDLSSPDIEMVAAHGAWIAVGGRAWKRFDYAPHFLLDVSTKKYHRIHEAHSHSNPVTSRQGNRAVWLAGRANPFTLTTLDLLDPAARPVETPILFSSSWISLALSPDGSRVAALEGGRKANLSVYELSSGRMLASSALPLLPYPWNFEFFFVSEDRVRIYTSLHGGGPGTPASPVEIFEFDVVGKKLIAGGRFGKFDHYIHLKVSQSGTRLLLLNNFAKEIHLFDAWSGESLARLPSDSQWKRRRVEFLSDDRIVVVEVGDVHGVMRLFGPDGHEQKSIPLGRCGSAVLGGEPRPGSLLVYLWPHPNSPLSEGRLLTIDLEHGDLRPVAKGLMPIWGLLFWTSGPDPSVRPTPGSEATKLFWAGHGSLVHFDPLTNERRVVLKARGEAS